MYPGLTHMFLSLLSPPIFPAVCSSFADVDRDPSMLKHVNPAAILSDRPVQRERPRPVDGSRSAVSGFFFSLFTFRPLPDRDDRVTATGHWPRDDDIPAAVDHGGEGKVASSTTSAQGSAAV